MKCGFCTKPIVGVYYRTLNRFACTSCADQVRSVIARNVFTADSFLRAAGAGLAVGLGCAVAWAVIVHVTNVEIGIVASFIGYAVGKAVVKASGKRRGTALQWLAAALSVVGIIGGKLLLVSWTIVDFCNQKNIAPTPGKVTAALVRLLVDQPSAVFSGFDLLWLGLAVYAAFRLCKAPRITIAGPYAAQAPTARDLQFETIEPADSPSAPGQP